MSRQIALVRGINVGGNSRVPMAVLKSIFAKLGCTDVVTVLNSGNVVFSGHVDASALESRIREETGVSTRALVLTAARLGRILDAYPASFPEPVEGNEPRIIIMFMGAVPASVDIPDGLSPELVHIGSDAVYQWLPDGVSNTKLKPAFWKQFPADATGRNLRTARKLHALAVSGP